MAITDLIPWNRKQTVDNPRHREDPFWTLQREVNRMFEDFARGFDLAPWSGPGWEGFQPRIDLRETDAAILVTAEMPGLEEKDFDLSLADGMLTLKGEKRRESEEEGPVHRVERSYGAFERTVPLPCEVDAEKATARYRSGVLTVTLPKTPAARRRMHRIDVKSG